jgi:hypothetical protein
MPRDLHKKIQREADRRGQTINAEILGRLEGSFEIKQTLDRIEGRLPNISELVMMTARHVLRNVSTVSNATPATTYPPEEKRTNKSTATANLAVPATKGGKSDD